MSGLKGACPQCGAPVEFGGASSLATVCSYCRAAVARRGIELELIGKVPDLVSTDTRLALGHAGKIDGKRFRIIGRLQLSQGAAAWDEWYASFDGDSDGWLAEAKGQLFVTWRAASLGVPAFESLQPGARVKIAGLPALVVDEVGTASFTSAEGDLPFRPAKGATYRFADLSGKGGEFATLDYGAEGDEPEVFAGKRTSYAAAGLAEVVASRARGAATAAAGPEGEALACPSCGAPVALRRPESESAACASCRALLDVSAGKLAVIGKLGKRTEPLIPLGTKGALRGEQVEVLGYLRRFTDVDNVRYHWSEWQLHGESGYSWLGEYNGHFSLQAPIAAGEVEGDYKEDTTLISGHDAYHHFQTARARYEDIQGELSWRARATDVVRIRDYVNPPLVLSCEEEKGEVSWSRGEWLPAAEVWKAFALPGHPPAPIGVAPAQPNPYKRGAHLASWSAVIGVVALIVLAVFVAATLPHEKVATLSVPLVQESVAVSDFFELPASSQAVQLRASADLSNAWAGLDVALVNDSSGEAHTLALELSQYEGIDDGERWSEGSRTAQATVGSIPAGRYFVRAEVTVDPASASRLPPAAQLEVVRGVFTWAPLVLALLALWPVPLYLTMKSAGLERARWAESDHDYSEVGD